MKLPQNMHPLFVQSGSIWLAEHQQLHIELQPLLGKPGTLILTGWDFSIRWMTVIDGETTINTNPFAESLFPIEFIDNTLPEAVISLLKRYKGNAFGMLIVSRYPYALQLFLEQPTLFWMAFSYAQVQQWREAQFVACCRAKRTAIVDACGLPAARSTVKLLQKIQVKVFCRYEYDQIRALLRLDDFAVLNHRESVPLDLINLILEQTDLLKSKFVINWQDDCSHRFQALYWDIMRH